jgi:alpha-methylacyl-CoA racemase
MSGFFEGVRVLEFTQFVPGPFTALMLADLGAQVLKIEPPGGDPQRMDGPLDSDGISAWYKLLNRNKTILKLDLKSPDGHRLFMDLLARADVLLESYRPGVLERLGLGRDRLNLLNPRLVHCALSGWGQTGPYRLRAGHDVNYLALAGVLSATGTEEMPAIPNPPMADYGGALFAAFTVAAALLGRERAGRGAYIDVSLAEAILAWGSIDLTGAVRPGFAPERAANLGNGGFAAYNIYRTADRRFVTLGIMEDKFWRNFCKAVDQPNWVSRIREPLPQRTLIAELATLFAGRSVAEWQALLDPVETCFHAVVRHDEIPTHPQVKAREVVKSELGPNAFVDVLFPAWIDGKPPAPRRPMEEIESGVALARWC